MGDVPYSLVAVNLTVIALGAAMLGMAASRLLRGQALVPYSPRGPNDAGGVLSALARRKPPLADDNPPIEMDSSLRSGGPVADIALGVCGFLVMFLPVLGLQAVLVNFVMDYEHPLIDEVLADRSASRFLAALIAAVVIAPVLEELIFRNLLQGGLEVLERRLVHRENWCYGAIPIFVSSLLFAAVHWGQGPAAIPLFFFALMLGYLYFQTHRLLPVIAAHAALNLFSMIQLGFLTFGTNT